MKAAVKKLTKEIFDIIIRINYETTFCAFIHFSGHVSSLDIKLTHSRRKYDTDIYSESVYVAGSLLEIEEIQKVKRELLKFLPDDKN